MRKTNWGGVIDAALDRVALSLSASRNKYVNNENGAIFKINHSVSYAIFLYRLSNELYRQGKEDAAAYVYYLNKVMHSVDWFYAVNLPAIFMAEHPLGTVLGRAEYGDYFMVYQGCTVGGNRKGDEICYPRMGHHVLMYANSTVLGNSTIGNHVVVSAGTYIKDTDIPDDCIVYGQTPHLVIKEKKEAEMKKMFSPIWKTP